MCFKRFLAHENICLDIKISQIRQLIAEYMTNSVFSKKNQNGRQASKMAAKKMPTIFFP